MLALIIVFASAFLLAYFLVFQNQAKQKQRKPWPKSDFILKPRSRKKRKPKLSASSKGQLGEEAFRLTAKLKLHDCYRIIHDVTLQIDEGGTTQIDHIIVSRYGVFIVETKARSDWIFGSEKQPRWTQQFHNTSNQFQNPLRQNYKQGH